MKTIETEKNFHENIRNNVASLTWVFCVCFSKKDNAAEENKLKTIYTYVEGSTYIIYKLCSLISSFVCSKRFSTLVFCSRFSQFIQEWFENTHCQHPKVIAFGNWSKCCCSPVTTHTRRSTPNKNPPKITIINKQQRIIRFRTHNFSPKIVRCVLNLVFFSCFRFVWFVRFFSLEKC